MGPGGPGAASADVQDDLQFKCGYPAEIDVMVLDPPAAASGLKLYCWRTISRHD